MLLSLIVIKSVLSQACSIIITCINIVYNFIYAFEQITLPSAANSLSKTLDAEGR